MKNILLPTDFSKNALNAIIYAMEFFADLEINFFVINIQKTSGYTTSELLTSPSSSTVYKGVLNDNKLALQELIDSLQSKYHSERFTFKGLLDFDVFTDAIQQAVVSNNIDLIIMGTNGATGAKEVIFGSNTLKVIRQVDCPLITVPEGYEFQKIKSILLSFSPEYKFEFSKIEPLIDTISIHKSKLHILEVREGTTTSKDVKIQKSIENQFLEFNPTYYVLEDIPIAMAISTFEQLNPINLHVMFVAKEDFISRFIFGSETSKISYASKIPMMILHQ